MNVKTNLKLIVHKNSLQSTKKLINKQLSKTPTVQPVETYYWLVDISQ